jgi:hypothetical protein
MTTCLAISSGLVRDKRPFWAGVKGDRQYPAITTFFILMPLMPYIEHWVSSS